LVSINHKEPDHHLHDEWQQLHAITPQ